MSEAKVGEEFIKHEFDEAIAVQQSIVEYGKQLAEVHPMADTRRELKEMARTDAEHLKALQKHGKRFGATGKREEVAQGLEDLGSEVASAATADAPASEKYELHAVVLNMKRKQQDSAAAVVKIATKMRDAELKADAQKMQREIKSSCEAMAKSLAALAVDIATEKGTAASAR